MRQGDQAPVVVVLGTGGTIAGVAASADDPLGYTAATLGIERLIESLPVPAGLRVEAEQVLQLDSKDMSPDAWQRLALRARHHLARPEVCGLVIAHGTDTLEESAWFLQRVLEPERPVVLVAAMRPATSLQADGPQNLVDGMAVVQSAAAQWRGGVMAVMGSRVWASMGVRKVHTFRLDALRGGDGGPLGAVEAGVVAWWREAPAAAPLPAALREAVLKRPAAQWPRVAVLASHAGSDGGEVLALVQAGFHGLVVAGTGHATLHHRLREALDAAPATARAAGHRPPAVWICTRCPQGDLPGALESPPGSPPIADPLALTAWQARVELQLRLMG